MITDFASAEVACKKLDLEQCVYFAAKCVEKVLCVFEQEFPDNKEVREAVEAATSFDTSKVKKALEKLKIPPNSLEVFYAAVSLLRVRDLVDASSYAAHAVISSVYATGELSPVAWDYVNNLYNTIHTECVFPKEWKTKDATNVAKTLMESDGLEEMPILADALEDAGCDETETLHFLRSQPHLWSKGAWVLRNLSHD